MRPRICYSSKAFSWPSLYASDIHGAHFNDSSSQPPSSSSSVNIFLISCLPLLERGKKENSKQRWKRGRRNCIAFRVCSTGKNCITTAIKRQTSKLKCTQKTITTTRTRTRKNKMTATTMGKSQ